MWFVEAIVVFGLVGGVLAEAHAPVTRLYVFGDSYSDIGEGYLDGNGPTAVAYLARKLGFELVRMDQSKSATDSLDFAVSGAQTGSGDGEKMSGGAVLGFGMQNQVTEFARRVHAGKIRFEPQTTLFFFAGGLNDHNLPTETTVNNLKSEIRQVYALGGRRFAVALLPTAIPAFSAVGVRLNPAIEAIPAQMKTELAGAEIRLSRWGVFFDEVMKSPPQYGIQDTTNACAGRALFNEDAKPCATPNAHYYYHAGHPSTAVHKIVGAKLAEEVISRSK